MASSLLLCAPRKVGRISLPGPIGFLAGGWGWLGANGWRATADRFELLGESGALEFGAAEMCFVVCGTAAAIVGLAWWLRAIGRIAPATRS
jgi:hypothetical protein